MKTFYTSNYDRNGTNPMAIAISEPSLVPDTYTGVRNEHLAPRKGALDDYHAGTMTEAEYKAEYLAKINLVTVADEFPDGTVFLCFDYEEESTLFCHRFFLSEALNNAGVATVTEI